MQSFAKVLSGVPKKIPMRPVARPRILIPVDSRAFVLGNPRIATVEAATGQGRRHFDQSAVMGPGRGARERRGNLLKFQRLRVPDRSGRTSFPCSRLRVRLRLGHFLAIRKTKLGFVNFWCVTFLKGISANREFGGRR
jgi:hypothetical protein